MEKTEEKTIRISPFQNKFGAEVRGLNLSGTLREEEFRRLETAWLQYSFLVFREIEMTPEQHVTFTRRFGRLHIMTPLRFNLPGHPEIMVLSNAKELGNPIGLRKAGMGWHTDGEDKRIPNAGSLLYALRVPEEGGDTLYADMYAAYEVLPEETKEHIAKLKARFSRNEMHSVYYPDLPPLTEAQKRERPDVFHPIVRTHPRSGRKALYVGRWARDIEGMSPQEGRALVAKLFAYASQPQFVYRHRWQPHDAVLWDNRCMLHCATPFDEERYERLMHRTTLEGELPI